jgi:hypothetical protein
MKNVKHLLLTPLLISFFACSDTRTNDDRDGNIDRDRDRDAGTTGYNGSTSGNVESSTSSTMYTPTVTTESDFSSEWNDYRNRMNTRIDELDRDIDNYKERRRVEKNSKRVKEYDVDIERRENRRTEFKNRMNNFEARTKQNWQEFKTELDDLFDRDKNDRDFKNNDVNNNNK